MAGHSKWANIKHRKAAQDSKRGKIFTKLIRELVVATKESGPDVENNPRLRAAVDKALSNNMTRDTINRAIKRGAGGDADDKVETITYEGYGPGGTAIMVECMTDNKNRSVSAVRFAFSRAGGNLGTDGSVNYLFSKKGIISYPVGTNEDELLELALEIGADDIETNSDSSIDVYTTPDAFGKIKDALDAAGFVAQNAEVTLIPSTTAQLDEDTAPKLLNLIDTLEELDDVQEVYHNGDVSDEIAATL